MGMSEQWRDWEEFYLPLASELDAAPSVTLQRPLPSLGMKICLWNVRGASKDNFIPHAWIIVEAQRPEIFILLETKSEEYRAREVMYRLRFDEYRVIPPSEKRGGIWLFWKKEVDVINYTASINQFHVLFHFKNIGREALVTGMHAPSVPENRHRMWREMQKNLPPRMTPWMMMGDLNEITGQGDKQGGRPFRTSQCRDLSNFVDAAGLIDLGYNGCPFTWTNARDGAALIKERLDRALVNSPWLQVFPYTKVHHLPRTYSDHAPILV